MAGKNLSPKGQVVIPEEVILKVIQPPNMSEFAEIVGQARRAAKRAGMKKVDDARAVRKVRKTR